MQRNMCRNCAGMLRQRRQIQRRKKGESFSFFSLEVKFKDVSEREHSEKRINALRQKLKELDLDGFIIPHSDEFQGEYLPAYAERLAWLTGFTGSAGSAIVLADKAAIFIDGRYTIQVVEQTDNSVIKALNIADTTPTKWLAKNLGKGARLGFDPWLLTASATDQFEKAAHGADAVLIATETNPIEVDFTMTKIESGESKIILGIAEFTDEDTMTFDMTFDTERPFEFGDNSITLKRVK